MQAVNLTVPGIQTAPPFPPGGEIADKDLPCVVLRVGPADWLNQVLIPGALPVQSREWIHEVYVVQVREIIGKVDPGWDAVEPILQALGLTYLGNIMLDGVVHTITRIWDDGIEELRYGPKGKRYWGFRLHTVAVER